MKLRIALASMLAATTLTTALATSVSAQTLTVITAGDTNMVDYINDYLGPKFEETHPGVTVRGRHRPGRWRQPGDL